jgi:hypothetical protein
MKMKIISTSIQLYQESGIYNKKVEEKMDKQGLLSLKKNKNGSYIILIQYCKDGTFLKSTGVSLPKLNTTQVEFFKRKQKLPSNVPNYEIFNNHKVGELDKFDNLIIILSINPEIQIKE